MSVDDTSQTHHVVEKPIEASNRGVFKKLWDDDSSESSSVSDKGNQLTLPKPDNKFQR